MKSVKDRMSTSFLLLTLCLLLLSACSTGGKDVALPTPYQQGTHVLFFFTSPD